MNTVIPCVALAWLHYMDRPIIRLSCSNPVHSGKKELVTEGGAAGPSHCLCNANFLEILLTLLLFWLEKPKESRILSRAKARTQVFLLWAYLEYQLYVQPLSSVFPSLPSTTVGNSSSAENDCGPCFCYKPSSWSTAEASCTRERRAAAVCTLLSAQGMRAKPGLSSLLFPASYTSSTVMWVTTAKSYRQLSTSWL